MQVATTLSTSPCWPARIPPEGYGGIEQVLVSGGPSMRAEPVEVPSPIALRQAQDGALRQTDNDDGSGAAVALRQAQDGALRQAQDGALRQAQDGALRQAQDGALRQAQGA
jgi:hypothetical protein